MTREAVMEAMKNHGLYCVPLASAGIGLTDKGGSLYDAEEALYWADLISRQVGDAV